MGNMNGITRNQKYQEIAQRDGEYCKCCGKLPNEGQLVIDHRDNNNCNNSLNNLQLLCRSCNYLKNPRKSPLDLCVSENDKFEARLSKFRQKEIEFEEYLDEEIENSRAYIVGMDDAIHSGAQKVGISIITAERYLKKLISKEGRFKKWEQPNGSMGITKKEMPRFAKELLANPPSNEL